MATPIVHVALTDKIFNKSFKNRNKGNFFIGTCLPDIRYLKVIDRKKTHFTNVKFADLKKENAFIAGLKFHSILDKVREDYIIENNTYAICPDSKHSMLALKILEDRVLYDNIQDWNEYIDYLNEILPDEISLGLKKDDVKKWHTLLQQLFSHSPNKQSIQDFASELFFTDQDINEIDEIATQLNANKKIIEIIKNLYKNFDDLINDYIKLK